MDLARFVMQCSSARIRFTKLAALASGDPFEGYTRARGFRAPTAKRAPTDPTAAIRSMASSYAARTMRNAPKHVYVSSWCAGVESMGMWETYGLKGHGVAVRSTVGRFKDALARTIRKEQYTFGPVSYEPDLKYWRQMTHDFRKGSIPQSGNLWQLVLSRGFNKRSAYENEWRAAVFQEQLLPAETGVELATDLDILIEGVLLGPRAEGLMKDAVQAVMDGFRIAKPLTRSTLLDRP